MSWLSRKKTRAHAPGASPAVILFGASITEWSFGLPGKGFGSIMEEKFEGKADVWNEGKIFVRIACGKLVD